ncbi:MAG: spore coat protein [Limnochordaceae bacterium]|nr:spore coat protein [Limnochordaceae bacterium]
MDEQKRPEAQNEGAGYRDRWGYGDDWGEPPVPSRVHELWHLYRYLSTEATDAANLHRAIHESAEPELRRFFETSLRDELEEISEICMLLMRYDPAFRDAMMRRMRPSVTRT